MGNILNDPRKIKELDKSNMLDLLLGFDEQCLEAKKNFSYTPIPADGIKNIVFTGLGGSAIGADLIRSYTAQEIKLPIMVNRDYTLPNFVDENTLLFASSYSGNTEETLAAFEEAKRRKARIIAISSNGTLEQSAKESNITFIKIPAGLPPRCALGYSFVPPLFVLSKLGLIGDKTRDLDETVKILSSIKGELGPGSAVEANIAKRIAVTLENRYPIIYGANNHIDVAITRWRGELAENSKHLASGHVFPEMNHNEIVGWDFPAELIEKFIVVFLRDRGEHERVARRMEITREILRKKRINVIEISSRGDGLLSRIISLIYIGDMVSFYLAILNGVDPTPVDRVTYLKRMLKESHLH